MAGVKISNLPAATTPTGPELVPLVQAGTTKRTTVSAFVSGGLGYTPVNKAGDTMSGQFNYASTVSIASATTTNIAGAASNDIIITGTTTITGFGTVAAGALRVVTFAGALILTHNGASLILPGAANITTAAGDVAVFKSLGSGNWRCVSYQRASGLPVVNPPTPSQGLGFGQTWQNLTASRALGTDYTNGTISPIFVSVYCSGSPTDGIVSATVGGIQIGRQGFGAVASGVSNATITFVVPPTVVYRADNISGASLNSWCELR
jgi:hypothetical protein